MTAATKLPIAERRGRARALRAEGLTFAAIGKVLGCSETTAYYDVAPAKTRLPKEQANGTLRCPQCDQCKPAALFGANSWCRDCLTEKRRAKGVQPAPEPLDHPEGMKVCRTCRAAKAEEDFSPSRRGVKGRNSRCRQCVRLAYGPDYVYRDGRRRGDVTRDQRLRRLYGITLDDYRRMWDRQDGRCKNPGCRALFTDGRWDKLRAHVDHCHVTGKVRGLLCFACNVGIGSFLDDPGRLEGAARYLREVPA